ncbi:recombination-associated protein RdgC [Aquabacterium sp.]|uniref:recombination-associated protein RdgC n=1 Tax=Aquabacterium sp. TaxID=1872578 RepID=UPI0035ADCBF7
MFKNATVFRISDNWASTLPQIEEQLRDAAFTECQPTQQQSTGWIAPREANGVLAEFVSGELILKLRTDTRKVPSDVLNKHVDDLADRIENSTGRKPGRKERKELKEQALHELLPHAFIKTTTTLVWIDRANRMLVIDSASSSRVDAVVTSLVKTLEGLAVCHVVPDHSPAGSMAFWLQTGEPPYGFSVDRECELKSQDEMKSVVRYGRHPLDTDEIKQHIVSGKIPTKLAMTWRDRVSFVLTDTMVLKKLALLDVVMEGKTIENASEAFDANVSIFTGEFTPLFADLLDGLGGEAVQQEGGAA